MSEKHLIRVRDVMNTGFDVVDGMDTVAQALKAAQHINTRCFVVKARNEQDEYGLVLLSDIAKKVLAKNKSPERVNIYEIMAKPVISVHPDMDIRYCSRLFERFGIRRAPVLDNHEVIGIVGYSDIVLQGIRDRLA